MLEAGLHFVETLALLGKENDLLVEQMVALLAKFDLLVEPFFVCLYLSKLCHRPDLWDQKPQKRRQLFVRSLQSLFAVLRKFVAEALEELFLLWHVD